MNLRNEMNVSISFGNVVLMASVLLRVAENAFAAFPLRALANFNCWLTTNLSQPVEDSWREMKPNLLLEKNFDGERWASYLVVLRFSWLLSIGAIFAPSISLDASSIAGLAVESGKTYEEAVSEYGVFFIASGVLVKARFVLKTKFDYLGLFLLAAAGDVSIGMVFFIQAYQFIRRKLRERQLGPKLPSYGHREAVDCHFSCVCTNGNTWKSISFLSPSAFGNWDPFHHMPYSCIAIYWARFMVY
jgi:hypothetical protein